MIVRHDEEEREQKLTPIWWSRVSPHERVLDRVADLLLGADEILGMLKAEENARMRWLVPLIEKVYGDVDGLMKKMTD